MPSDLEQTRNHARKMADWPGDRRDKSSWTSPDCGGLGYDSSFTVDHDACTGESLGWPRALCACACHPRTVVTEAERALWRQIADEIDAHLADPSTPTAAEVLDDLLQRETRGVHTHQATIEGDHR